MRWGEVLANYGATMAVVVFGVWFYTRATGYHRNEFTSELALKVGGTLVQVRTSDLLTWLGWLYALILLPYYAMLPGVVSKARVALGYVVSQFFADERPRFGREEQQAFLALALKLFFVPLMLNWLLGLSSDVASYWRALASAPEHPFLTTFNTYLYLLLFKIMLGVDVAFFTVGYLVEIPALDNEIRTVDPTVSGWVVCLACYPPFNIALNAFFPWQASDFPAFHNVVVHVALNCTILMAMAIYASASVALGRRASNLTNRGIVRHGPYAWVRHPAYAAKNLAWWIGAVPGLLAGFAQSLGSGLWAAASMAAWTTIYVLRALTEERHLLMLDNGYSEYMKNVPYRFIPRLW